MQNFIKQPGPDPAIRTPNDSATAMFGHLNVLVNAITALQNTPLGWSLTGNNTLPLNAYIGSNDPNVDFLSFKINGVQSGYIDNTNNSVFFGKFSKTGNNNNNGVIAYGISAAGDNIGNLVFAFGFAARNNIGTNVVAIGNGAGDNNQGSNVIGIGVNSSNLNRGTEVITLGSDAGFQNQGNNVVGLGYRSAGKNLKDNVIALGNSAGYNSSLNTGNNIAGVTMIATASLPTYVDHAAATNPVGGITIGNGGVAGTTYLYRRSSDNSIGYVSL